MPTSHHAREEARVREANRHFYQAAEALSLEEMEAVWMQGPNCRCVHPGWPMVTGWSAVRESWRQIFENTRELNIALEQVNVSIEGGVAWVSCIEHVRSVGESRMDHAVVCTSNLFVLSEDEWKIVLHHASPVPEPDGPANSQSVH
ncbi:MAG: nuclear transport factor 2 family protein [Terriglobales bacterium]